MEAAEEGRRKNKNKTNYFLINFQIWDHYFLAKHNMEQNKKNEEPKSAVKAAPAEEETKQKSVLELLEEDDEFEVSLSSFDQ